MYFTVVKLNDITKHNLLTYLGLSTMTEYIEQMTHLDTLYRIHKA